MHTSRYHPYLRQPPSENQQPLLDQPSSNQNTLSDTLAIKVICFSLKYDLPSENIKDATEQLQNLAAWLMFFRKAYAVHRLEESDAFDINRPFSMALNSDNIKDFIRDEILKGISYARLDAATSELDEWLQSLIHSSQENDRETLDLSIDLKEVDTISVQSNFNRWPNKIKSLALKTAHTRKGHFENADLSHLDLREIDFQRAHFQGANLNGSNLSDSTFTYANFQHATLLDCDFDSADFDDADLSHAQLSAIPNAKGERHIDSAIFAGANFSHAKISNTLFLECSLAECLFYQTTLLNIGFLHTNFSEIDFSSTHFLSDSNQLPFDLEVDRITTNDFNHLRYGSGSTLLSIHSIPSDKYQKEKKELIGIYINLLTTTLDNQTANDEDENNEGFISFETIAGSLRDFFLKNPEYNDNKHVAYFINNYLLPDSIEHWNTSLFHADDPSLVQLGVVLDYLLTSTDESNWLIENHTLINQFLARERLTQTLNFDIPEPLKNNLQLLKNHVQNNPLIQQLEASMPLPDNLSFFFNDEGTQVIACGEKLFDHLLANNLAQYHSATSVEYTPQWGDILFFSKINSNAEHFTYTPVTQPEKVIATHPVLFSLYLQADHKGIRADLIDQVLTIKESEHSYGQQLIDACKINTLPLQKKWIGIEHQTQLGKNFNAVLTPPSENNLPAELISQHSQNLWNTFFEKAQPIISDLQHISTHQAGFMLALATFYCQASSAKLFGTERDSPEALRHYTSALLQQAHSLDPKIFDQAPQKPNESTLYQDLQNRLLGRKNAFTCTAVLTEKLTDHISTLTRTEEYNWMKDIFLIIFPPLWR